MATRGPNNIYSGEIMPVAPEIKDPELAAFHRNLLDYLRRLTGKLARFGGGGDGGTGVKSLASYALLQFDSAKFAIVWEASLWQDDIFTFSGPASQITVLESGNYTVEVDWCVFKNFSDHVLYIKVNGSSSTYRESFLLTPDVGRTYSFMIPLVLNANDVVTIEIESSGDVGCQEGTRLLITKLGDLS